MNVQRGFVTSLTLLSMPRRFLGRGGAAAAVLALAACSGGGNLNIGNSQTVDPATVDFPIFYVKRTIPKTAAGVAISDDLRMLRDAFPQADLYKRDGASPSATETNITARITAKASYDVKDVDTSTDGKKVAFAMRGPLTANMKQKDPPSWRIYEYVIASDTLTPMIDPKLDTAPATVNDVSPHYLPDGRIVFSSTRQRQSQAILLDEGKPQFIAEDEERTEPAFVLHVISADRTQINQISFNQSHDRDATVLLSGRVLWSRWDHAPGKDGMHLYSSNPDGTDLQLYYGANSHMTGTNNTVIEFVRPREMQNGKILSLVRQYTNVDYGGNLVIIDGVHYVENTQPTLANATLTGPAQVAATQNNVVTIPGPSPGGRFNSAYPLWDGTNRILVTWTQCRLLNSTKAIVPCTDAALAAANPQLAPPLYSVWMFNPTANTFMPVMQPIEGVMVTDIVAAQPRPLPNIILDKVAGVDLDQELVNEHVGVLDIKSVYDFDGVDAASPNIATLADGKTPASQRPARFIRLEKPVSIPDITVVNLAGAAFGASDVMREILGYAPIEPDGSVRVKVPANVAFQMSVVDANGRRIFPTHDAWLQLRPGEVVMCNGCHKPATAQAPVSHGRAGLFAAAYSGAATAGTPFADSVATFLPNAGETMAEARARTTCVSGSVCSMGPSLNVLYTDVWTDTAKAPANPAVSYRYDDSTQFTTPIPSSAACVSTWAANCRIVINYPKYIQALWDQPRQTVVAGVVTADHTCTQAGCHDATGAAKNFLNLTKTASNDEPLQPISYRQLLFAHNVPGPPVNGNPTTISVGPYMDAGSANGALSSAFLGRFAAGSASTHASWLTPAELRLISEWLDIGAQFFNNPFDPAVPVN
jgi:hypothetical protein